MTSVMLLDLAVAYAIATSEPVKDLYGFTKGYVVRSGESTVAKDCYYRTLGTFDGKVTRDAVGRPLTQGDNTRGLVEERGCKQNGGPKR